MNKNYLTNLYKNMKQRERLLALAGIFFIGVLFLYVIVYAPYSKSVTKLKASIVSLQQDRLWMEGASITAKQLQDLQKMRGTGESGLSFIDLSASQNQLSSNLKRVEPGQDNMVRVWLENAVYTDIIGWLHDLDNHGFRITDFSAERLSSSGHVNANISLQASQ